MSRLTLFSILGLTTLCAGLVIMLDTASPEGKDSATAAVTDVIDFSREPDLRLGGATITEFGADGRLRYHLDAKAMARYENSEETLLGSPSLRINPESGGAPWDVESTDGAIRQITRKDGTAETIVLLRRGVVLKQLDQKTGRVAMTIRSEAIDLFPERQFAKSDTDVMIDSDVGRTLAIGMEGDLKTGQLRLASKPERPVHTIVLPTQFKQQTSSS